MNRVGIGPRHLVKGLVCAGGLVLKAFWEEGQATGGISRKSPARGDF